MLHYKVAQMDAVDLLKSLDDESVDLIFTDPAYESLEKHRAVGTTTRLKKKWFDIFPNERYGELFEQFHRVLRTDRHCYIMCDQETMFIIKPIGEQVGFKFKKILIWDKSAIGMGYSYRNTHEMILYLEKGKRALNDRSQSDILRVKRLYRPDYPTTKPVDLVKIPILQSTQPGELVCDPFCGSGTTGVAALREGRNFIGGDTNDEAVTLTRDRLRPISFHR